MKDKFDILSFNKEGFWFNKECSSGKIKRRLFNSNKKKYKFTYMYVIIMVLIFIFH